jgi:hypothetical protein
MRPMTWIVSGAAVVGLLFLTIVLVRFVGRGGPREAAAEEEFHPQFERPAPVDAAPRQAARPAARDPFAAMGRRRALPRFDPSVLAAPVPQKATAADLDRVRTAAKEDGVMFREAGSDKIYVVQRGTKFLIPNGEEFNALGYNSEKVTEVPIGALSALQDRPPDGTLIRERGKDHIWVYEGGHKRWITSALVFGKQGYDWKNVKTVPNGSIGDYTDGSPVQ